MLTVYINSYDQHFDTFACTFTESDCAPFESLIPAALLPYIAPKQVALCEDLPYDMVGQTIVLKDAQELFGGKA